MEQTKVRNTKENCMAWYGWIRNEGIRHASSSGGVFTAMAEYVLGCGGVVIGAYFDAKDQVIRHDSTDHVPLAAMRRSKYVESDMSRAIPLIKEALATKRMVLFCGTPCQCAGIRKRFGHPQELLLCDFFCHGVPSSLVFKDYLKLKERKRGAQIADYQFRTKDFGWSQYGIRIDYADGRTEKTVGRCEFFFTAAMMDNQFLRKSCYTCDKAMYHAADFTIGDFWGINKLAPGKNDNRGISILIANTVHAEQLIPELSKSMEIYPLEKHYLDYAFRVKTADRKIAQRNERFELYKKIGIKAFINQYYRSRLFLSRCMFALRKQRLKMEDAK